MTINYADDMLSNISNDGMTDELWNIVHRDVENFSKINIKNDRERNLYIYLDNFIDDLCKEFNCNDFNKNEIIQKSFEKLRHNDKVDLTDIRQAVYNSLNKNKKIAYPNIKGTQTNNSIPKYDIEKWVSALNEIYSALYEGKSKNEIIQKVLKEWNPVEKNHFENWLRYYEHNDHEKYGIQKSAAGTIVPTFPRMPMNPENISLDKRGPGRPKKVKSPEQDKADLISRLNSASVILDRFSTILPHDVWRRLSEMLFDLKSEILPLKTTATISDCIIRTASKFEKMGFIEGANLLTRVADDRNDIASKIDKALSGSEAEGQPDITPQDNLPMSGEAPQDASSAQTPPPEMNQMLEGLNQPPATGDTSMMPPAGVEESLPPPETPPSAPEEEKEESIPMDGENPFSGKNLSIKDVLAVLEPISKQLSEREFVRALSKADMMLDSMNIASHFPEIGEAQAKALELNIYVGTRIEKIINKLKGGLKSNTKEKENEAPEIEMNDFSSAPKKEKEVLEVTEEKPNVPEIPIKPGV